LNAEAFDSEGYFHTGDLFEINEKSELYYVDRIKDVIKYKYHYVRKILDLI
jgi:long-subunit acyl-CoA synthetase (AMP-forming)